MQKHEWYDKERQKKFNDVSLGASVSMFVALFSFFALALSTQVGFEVIYTSVGIGLEILAVFIALYLRIQANFIIQADRAIRLQDSIEIWSGKSRARTKR